MKCRIAFSMCIALCASFSARAGTLYDNIADSSDGNRSPGTTGQFQSFSTGASGFSFDDLKLLIAGSSSATATFSVDLYADSSTHPGALLDNLGIKHDNQVPSGSGLNPIDFSFSAITLAANTRYWIGITSANQSAMLWGIEDPSLHAGDVGIAGEFIGDSGNFGADTREAFQMQVNGDVITPTGTPEPADFLLAATGLVALGLVRRYRTRTSSVLR